MKFGKDFRNHLEQSLPEWRDKFFCYKPLKKLIKNLPNEPPELAGNQQPPIGSDEWFVGILEDELEKLNDFYVDKEEDFVIRLQELKDGIDRVLARRNRQPNKSEREFNEEMYEIRRAFVTMHGEMVLLKNYSSINFAALIKILKKYDKRTGRLLSLPFTRRALLQPFFTTEPLTRLVRECEENLELLFPVQPEIIEPNLNPATADNPQTNKDKPGPSVAEAVASLTPEANEVLRSTIAAIKTIQELRKASSTYNPMSLGRIFGRDDEATGAVTSDSDASSVSGLKGIDDDRDSVHSDA
ncbi:SPX domain-containing family protein [Rhynchospora pubera]|uniref:SPX domain-containing family protein n=1 Tax=Rhynchospora pubera TaxID=906938 RepID=A0AAV8FWE5_9POAL|nr:SPX domain-containing family protein [Rhynchospora pubera]